MHALDVAAFLLEQLGGMSAMKLQKLVYYAQAWSLALHKRPLFQQEIQAWSYGPVIPELYATHRRQFVVTREDIGGAGNASEVKADTLALTVVGHVVRSYGQKDGVQLSDLTHAEDPWRFARARVPELSRSQAIITHEAMQRFYQKLI